MTELVVLVCIGKTKYPPPEIIDPPPPAGGVTGGVVVPVLVPNGLF